MTSFFGQVSRYSLKYVKVYIVPLSD